MLFNQKQGTFDVLLRLVALSLFFQVALALPAAPKPASANSTPADTTPFKANTSKATHPVAGKAPAKPKAAHPKGGPPKSTLPAHVTTLAVDDKTGTIAAFTKDGKLYQKISAKGQARQKRELMRLMQRGGDTCTPLSADDLKKLPGFQKLDDWFHKKYGSGSANIVTNPSDYPGSGASLCVDTKAIPVNVDGQPSCQSTTAKIDGEYKGVTGQAQVSVAQGYSNEGSWTVEQTATIGIGVEFHATLGIPDIAEVGTSISTETSFSNSQSRGFTTTVDSTITQQLTIDVPAGKKCHAEIDVKSCLAGGKASVPLIASGWVWYNFDSATQADGQGDSHYKWAQTIESILTDVADRSSTVTVNGNMKGTSQSNYKAICN